MNETTTDIRPEATVTTGGGCPFKHLHGGTTNLAGEATSETPAPAASGCPVPHSEPVLAEQKAEPPETSIFAYPAPYDTDVARANSCYLSMPHLDVHEPGKRNQTLYIVPDGKLWPTDDDPRPTPYQRVLGDLLTQQIAHKFFPCMGAHNVISHAGHRVGVYNTMADEASTLGFARDFYRFIQEQKRIGNAKKMLFTAFLAIFSSPRPATEEEFEALLWKQLQMLHNIDVCGWDPDFSCNPKAPNWAYSFGGRAFFVVGFNGQSVRAARTFRHCAIMFNAEYQVQALRDAKMLEKWIKNIRHNDQRLQPDGTIHATIAQLDDNSKEHTQSEAAVYSGRANDLHTWVCPFQARPDVVDPKPLQEPPAA